MEDYKKKYEKALSRASYIKDYNTVATPQEVAELLFPELKESEDERIREDLICYFRDGDPLEHKEKDVIAWLENQGEQNPTWSEDDEYNLNWVIKDYEKASQTAISSVWEGHFKIIVDWLKSLKEKVQPQPKQEWSEEDEKMVEDIIEAIDTQYAVSDYNEMVSWLKSLKERMKGE